MARESCWDCVRKHIGQASVLMDESKLGYPHHRWYAVGHLGEAESECRRVNLTFAKKIRKARIDIIKELDEPNFDSLILEACEIEEDYDELEVGPDNNKTFEYLKNGTMQ